MWKYWLLAICVFTWAETAQLVAQEPENEEQSQQTPDPPQQTAPVQQQESEPQPDEPNPPEEAPTDAAPQEPAVTSPLPVSLPPIVDYQIEARLDVDAKMLIATQTLKYTNHAPDLIDELQFHIYLNAFKNNQATFVNNFGARSARWGYCHIKSLVINGEDRTADMRYIITPGASDGDQTVMAVSLNEPLAPGETVTIDFEYDSKLPKAVSRTGYGDERYFYVAQWFPKIGIWETKGVREREEAGWNCHSFHYFTEFYANFGNYDVSLEVPEGYIVGATGVQKEMTRLAGGDVRYRFVQDRVHDFAFTASTRFDRQVFRFEPDEWITEEEYQESMRLFGLTREQVALKPVDVIVLTQFEHRNQSRRHYEAAAISIKYMGLWYGLYPYETLTLVDPSRQGRETGGMEYPTIITLGTAMHTPKDKLTPEGVTIHEFIHQYWYGMVATNEFEDSWMDEGFTTYSQDLIEDVYFGPRDVYSSVRVMRRNYGINPPYVTFKRLDQAYISKTDLLGIPKRSSREGSIQGWHREEGLDPIARHVWEYHPFGYGANSYPKPGTMLHQLESELGSDEMKRVMRTYFQEWKFRHPGPQDFIEVVNRVSGRDMNWFFDELLFKAGTVDYKVDFVFTDRYAPDAGYLDTENGPELNNEPSPNISTGWATIVNDGNIHYPVDILITYTDGSTVTEHWDGKGRWKKLSLTGDVDMVEIDPQGRILIDKDRSNNSWRSYDVPEPAKRVFAQWLLRAQRLLQLVGGGF